MTDVKANDVATRRRQMLKDWFAGQGFPTTANQYSNFCNSVVRQIESFDLGVQVLERFDEQVVRSEERERLETLHQAVRHNLHAELDVANKSIARMEKQIDRLEARNTELRDMVVALVLKTKKTLGLKLFTTGKAK